METIIIIFVGLLGMVLGSFYACMGYRIPNKIPLTKPNSFCENCKREIKWYMNIPIFSYIFLKGKCAYCKSKIDPLSFIVEIITSLLFVLFYLKFGLSTNFLLGLVLTSVLSVTIVSDFKYYYISDRVVVLGLLFTLAIIHVEKDYFFEKIISAFVVTLLILIVKLIGDKVFKRESLGWGDIKLLFFISLSIGFYSTLISLIIACSTTLIYYYLSKREEKEIPFGPFLLIGALIVLFVMPSYSVF